MNVDSTSAKILYRPVGLTSSVVGGLVAAALLKQVRQRAAPGETPGPPTALQTSYPFKEILSAAAVQGNLLRAEGDDRPAGRLTVREVDGRMAGALITGTMA